MDVARGAAQSRKALAGHAPSRLYHSAALLLPPAVTLRSMMRLVVRGRDYPFETIKPTTKASSLYARFCRGARCCQSRSLPPPAQEAGVVQLRACGVLRTACDSPSFRLGLETG